MVAKTLSSACKRIKTPERGEGSMADLLGVSSTIRTSFSADIFYSMTDMVHWHRDYSDNHGNNDVSCAVTPTPPRAVKSKVANTTQKLSVLFNQSLDIKVGYFGNFEFVDSQRDHHETLGSNPWYFLITQPTRIKPYQRMNYIKFLNFACLTYLFILLENFMSVYIKLLIQGAHRRCAKQLKI